MPTSEKSLAEASSVHGTTHVSMVATQFKQVMEKSPSACLRTAIVGEKGALPRSILEKAVNKDGPIHTTVCHYNNEFNGYAQ